MTCVNTVETTPARGETGTLKRIRDAGAMIGALAGAFAFLVAGVVPGLVYGGYMGVLVGASVSGGSLSPGDLASTVILAGMGIGVICSGFLFVASGAAVGALVGWAAEPGTEEDGHVLAH